MKIKINELRLFGYHGLYKEEKENGQEFLISVTVTQDNKPENDDISNVIDYSLLVKNIKEIFESKRYNLIESLAVDISDRVMLDRRISSISISVKKENPPIDIDINSVEVVYEAIQK